MGIFSILITAFFIVWGLIDKDSKIAVFGLLVLLYILFAFEKTDGDYLVYLAMFNQIGYGIGKGLESETLFVFLCKVANSMNMTFDAMRKIVCVFELIFLYSTIKKYTSNVAMVLALFFIYPAFLDAELFRWLLGMCFVIYGFQFLLKGRNVRDYGLFALLVIVASQFHTSCWFFMMYLLLAIKDRSKLIRVVSIILIVGMAFSGTGLFFHVLGLLPIRTFVIEKYQTGSYANVIGFLFQIVKQVFVFMMVLVSTGRINFNNGNVLLKYRNDDYLFNVIKTQFVDLRNSLDEKIYDFNIISFLILIPLYFSSSVQRLVHVVVFFNYISLANKCQSEKNSFDYTVYSAVTAILLLLSLLFIESTGAVDAFLSHFTEGYFTNLFSQLLFYLF